MKKNAPFSAAFFALMSAASAHAQDCQLKLVNTIPLTMTNDGLVALVPVGINGTDQMMLLDTGGYATQLSSAAIEKLGLIVHEDNTKILDMYGHAAQGAVKVDSFTLGRLKDHDTNLLVSPNKFGGDPPVAGILATDYMGRFDLEFDFADAKLNYLSPQHCPGKVVYWPATAGAVVPMKPITPIDHNLRIDVTLDGHHFRAIIDTGASGTVLMASEAKRVFDLTEDSAGVRKVGGEKGAIEFQKVFDSLTFGDISVGHPRITIMPDLVGKHDPNNDFVTGSRVHHVDDLDSSDPPIIIGMNILTKLRFVVAFSEDKIYLTPAIPPAPSH